MSGRAFEVVIGLEVHAQLRTRSKMFCGCATTFGAPPNSQTCPVCQGQPGVLPVINRRALELGMRTALALGCRINPHHRFARKHYFYPDMPKNYQISQYEEPLAVDGRLVVALDGRERAVGIERLHLEEDVGKLAHEGALEAAAASHVDYNRAGVPLMEIVSRPDLRTPEEAAAYLRELRLFLRYLEVCDGNMEEGSLRCDANISLRPVGETAFGVKVEIKNMNSFRHVRDALDHEARRQAQLLSEGGRVVQETRLWNPERQRTVSMRSKEYAHDYRYFPEPDLPPLQVTAAEVEAVRATLPALPGARRRALAEAHGFTPAEAALLAQSRALADYFDETVRAGARPRAAANWIINELLREISGEDDEAVRACPVPPRHLAHLLALVEDGTISGKIAKDVFEKMLRTGEDAPAIVAREGLVQVADSDELARVVDQVLAANAGVVADYLGGKKAALGFLVGQVMKATGGRANPALVNRLLGEKLPTS